MSKEKLFTPEDFDKLKDKGFWGKHKNCIIAIAALLIIAAIFLYCAFLSKTEKKDEVTIQEYTEQISDTMQNDVYSDVTEAIGDQTSEESKEIEIENSEHSYSPSVEKYDPEITTEAEIHKTSTNDFDVSDDIELEAMNVIRGEYGNVPKRRIILGDKYQKIQNRVNQLKKEGVF